MALIDADKLIAPLAAESPCGPDLGYDAAFAEMERLAQGNPERQVGNTIIPAEDANWNQVALSCNDLLARTKDLRVLIFLHAAALKTGGLPEMKIALTVLKAWLTAFWNELHPRIDPSDGDSTERINVLQVFAASNGERAEGLLSKLLREATLVNSRQFGRFGWREIAVASGEWPPVKNEGPKLQLSVIDSAAKDCDSQELTAVHQAAVDSATLIREIESLVDERVGAGNGVDFKSFLKTLESITKHLRRFMGLRGNPVPNSDGDPSTDLIPGTPAAQSAGNGEITSTEDVVRVIDRICEFYARTEPSSPVPIVLRRAQRLVGKDFWQIVADLSPSALDSIKKISGTDGPETKAN